jgi:hypothetical protein
MLTSDPVQPGRVSKHARHPARRILAEPRAASEGPPVGVLARKYEANRN